MLMIFNGLNYSVTKMLLFISNKSEQMEHDIFCVFEKGKIEYRVTFIYVLVLNKETCRAEFYPSNNSNRLHNPYEESKWVTIINLGDSMSKVKYRYLV